jgi:hypothetical protein
MDRLGLELGRGRVSAPRRSSAREAHHPVETSLIPVGREQEWALMGAIQGMAPTGLVSIVSGNVAWHVRHASLE